MKRALLLMLLPALGWSQNVQAVVKHGEQVFGQSCATGYCHGVKGAPAGAPRLEGRGFDQSYIMNTVVRGLPGTAMPAFGTTLTHQDLAAVIAYVASLNGIANPSVNLGFRRGPTAPAEPALPAAAQRGHDLFFDAIRGFSRCSTCHEVDGVGIPVTTPIAKIPANPAALRALETSDVRTATVDGDSMPALIVAQGKRRAVFYDLTSVPPVLRTVEPGNLKVSEDSSWRHSSVIGSYNDDELSAILAYLRAVTRP